MKSEDTLFGKDFIILNAILFLSYFNVAVFFQFPTYLQHGLGIRPEWIGVLISVFALTGLLLRPFASVLIQPVNARRYIFFSIIGLVASLTLYSTAQTVSGVFAVRIVHGLFYAIFGTALMTEIVGCVPRSRSGQAFGMIAVITLLPYAVMPPLLKPLSEGLGGFVPVLLVLAALMLLVLPLAGALKAPLEKAGGKPEGKIAKQDFIHNFRNTSLAVIFLLSLFVFTSFSATFFYLKGHGLNNGLRNPGWFFTISTAMEIGVRIFAGSFFDRINKVFFLGASLLILGAGYFFLAVAHSPVVFFGLAVLFGLAWGVGLPLINSLIFDYSEPSLRPFNTNFGLEMFQGGFFLGSLAGGLVLSRWGYAAIFQSCALLCLACVALIFLLRRGHGRSVS
ncbi:MAG: MFS transporter [Deltaproteobacteria bacterium]|nr:MFS transporter [Deltaproteobacteria bacterium]